MAAAAVLILAALLTSPSARAASRLESLVDRGQEAYESGDFAEASAKWEEALGLARAGASRQDLCLILKNLAAAKDGLSEYGAAIRYGEEALDISRRNGNRPDIAESLTNLGAVYRNQGDYKKAVAYAEEAYGIFKKDGNMEGVGFTLTNLAVAHHNLGRFDRAVRAYEEALTLTLKSGDGMNHSNNLGNLGWAYYEQGDHRKALKLTEEALEAKRKLGDRQGTANGHSNLGNILSALGDYRKALAHFQEALKVYREVGDKKGEGIALSSLGLAHVSFGDTSRGISYCGQAMAIDREIGDRQGLGTDEENLGSIQSGLEDYPRAIEHLEAALRIQREVGVPTKTAERALADALLATGKPQQAQEVYRRLQDAAGLGMVELKAGRFAAAAANFRKDLEDADASKDADAMFIAQSGLGLALLELGDLASAREAFEKAAALAEDQRAGLTPEDRARFFSAKVRFFRRTEAYEGLIRTLAAAGQPEEAFYYSESVKARALADAISRGAAAYSQALPASLREEEEGIETRIRGLRKDLEKLFRAGDLEGYAEQKKGLARAKKERTRFISELRTSHPAYASARYPDPSRPADLRLQPDETLLEFNVTEHKTFLFLVDGSSKKTRVREIPVSRSELSTLVRQYRSFFDSVGSLGDLARYDARSGARLYQLLFGEGFLEEAKARRLIVVPDEMLALLPFESLPVALPEKESLGEGDHGPFPLGLSYLGDDASFSYAQSASSLMMQRSLDRGPAAKSILAVLDPSFSADRPEPSTLLESWRAMGAAGTKSRGLGATTGSDALFPPLTRTREIGAELRALFGSEVEELTGTRASKSVLRGLDLERYRLIVFGTHGLLETDLPYLQEPALVLARSAGAADAEGFLTMSEVMGLKVRAEVVALTACKTGLGREVGGEGVLGMGRAFQYAGAGSVLMSLWSVAEDGTVALARAFFRRLKDGESPRSSLRNARADIRKAGFENPFYWSSFILMGGS
jgi:tetratricopeptide (TPR) repeat protein